MFKNRFRKSCSIVAAAVAVIGVGGFALGAAALPYSTGFETSESFSSGTIDGQNGWNFPGSPTASPASTGTITSAAAHSGTQSLLYLPTADDGNVVKVSTPIFDPSGETPSKFVPAPVSSYMATDFWFRTAATSSDPGLYISTSMGNPASVRNTWLGVMEGFEAGSVPGNLYVGAFEVDAAGVFQPSLSPALTWGAWYHATIAEQYVNGANNDQVTYSIADASNTPIWSTTIGSWENYYATDPTAEQAPGPVVSDRSSFGGDVIDGGHGIYIDDFSMTNVAPVPEPASLGLLGLVGGLLAVRRRRA
jgi:hypothetical protein